jgi:plastocyanin
MKLTPRDQRSAPFRSVRLAGSCLLVATSLVMAGCGGGNDDSGSQATASTPTPAAKKQPATSPSGTVSLTPKGDQLMFDTNQLTAKAGSVTVDFTNDSDQDHNVTLIDSANKTLGQTPTFVGGTKSFSVSLKPGSYTYYCSVPGHRQAGMQGTLTVK